jgi:hypothetical protein
MLGDSASSTTSSSRDSETAVTTAAADSSGTTTYTVSGTTTETAADDTQETVNTADTAATDSTTVNSKEGLVPRAMRLLFDTLAAAAARDATAKMSYTVHASYLQASHFAVNCSAISACTICGTLSHS